MAVDLALQSDGQAQGGGDQEPQRKVELEPEIDHGPAIIAQSSGRRKIMMPTIDELEHEVRGCRRRRGRATYTR